MNNVQWEIDKRGPVNNQMLLVADWVDREFVNKASSFGSQRVLKKSHQVQAFLGEVRVYEFLKNMIEDTEWSGWKFEGKGDGCDILSLGNKIDVKTRSCNTPPVGLESYEVFLDEPKKGNQIQKPMDIYVFALWIPSEQNVWILGWTTKESFMSADSYRRIGEGEEIRPGSVANQTIHAIKVKDLFGIGLLPSWLTSNKK